MALKYEALKYCDLHASLILELPRPNQRRRKPGLVCDIRDLYPEALMEEALMPRDTVSI